MAPDKLGPDDLVDGASGGSKGSHRLRCADAALLPAKTTWGRVVVLCFRVCVCERASVARPEPGPPRTHARRCGEPMLAQALTRMIKRKERPIEASVVIS